MTPRQLVALVGLLGTACGGASGRPAVPPAPQASPSAEKGPATPSDATSAPTAPSPSASTGREPALAPLTALAAGLMPVRSTGVDLFRVRHPTYDGRGVLIAILDTGIDPGVDGLITTSTGAPKLIDLRDFSGEGRVALAPVTPASDGTVTVAGKAYAGAGRIARLTSATTWYAGVLRELPLGKLPASDLNGDGNNTDIFPVIVVKATDGWVAFIDTNLNGSFEDEMPLHDYRQGRETIALGTKPITLAANFAEANGVPALDVVFDNGGHGTHVAGIAAGHSLFGVPGFDGVAPGAQLMGLKIANAARGGISVTGSMERAMEYAARYAEQRDLPLVLNMSFGVGNEFEGRAVIDSIVDAFLLAHPAIVFTISAGNDGPGLSTIGFPGSADLALSIGAALPGAFARPTAPGTPPTPDLMGWWSSRGGELAKPDLVAPGVAFSSVPRWDTGNEIKAGTSMSAPHAAGLVACLLSAMQQEGRHVSAADVMQALRASAVPFSGATILDDGAGLPRLEAAYRWLLAEHQGSAYVVRADANGARGGAFRRDGLSGPGDTVALFHVRHAAGLRAAQFMLRSDVPWLVAPAVVAAGARETEIRLVYRPDALQAPGVHIGTVGAWNPNDSVAGPLFRLAATVIVPVDLAAHPLDDDQRSIEPGQVARYFVRATAPGATLEASVTLPDSLAQQATARLYEPNGQPFRDGEELSLGRAERGTGHFLVRAEDLVPGVYELDVLAPPLAGVGVRVHVAQAPLTFGAPASRVGGAGEQASELSSATEANVGAKTSRSLVGAERAVDVVGRGATPESLTVSVPEWATRAVVDVQMPREQWDLFTDFGVTEFDSTGEQVGQGAMNYAFGRHGFDLPATLRGHRVTVELFPAFARAGGAGPWHATARVRFLLAEPKPLGGGADVSIVAAGRALLALGKAPSLALPEGFHPLVELRVHPQGGAGPDAVRRVVIGP